ncbi:MAG TPA: acyl-CoA thioesterase, partial [Leptospiraceae bacterium]|nr:acyl-CoA thioesterase [Leptospiraceae bacterium]
MIITPIQIRFSDLDAMRRVNNSVYSSYLELGRMDFCKKYLEIQTLEDIPFVLVRVELDILKSLRTGEDA